MWETGCSVIVESTSAAMDSSDSQRKKVAVIGGGLVSIDFSVIPGGGVT